MKRIERILEQVSLNDIISEYNTGHISFETNSIIGKEKIDIEIVSYDDLYQINFYEEDNDDILIATYNVKK